MANIKHITANKLKGKLIFLEMVRFQKYSLENLKEAIKNSIPYRQVLSKLKIVEAGGNYSTLKRAIKEYQLDTSHFLGMAAKKGKIFGPKFPLSEYLNNNKRIISDKLKKRLIKENFFEYKCYSCYCKKCSPKYFPQKTKIAWPSLEELDRLLEKNSMVQVGKNLDVSDNAIRKHIKNKLSFFTHFSSYPEIPDNSSI